MFQTKKILGNIFLFISSLITCLIFVIILMRICVEVLGLDVKEIVCCLPRPDMWIINQDTGYQNKPFFKKRVFGNVFGVTNSMGFRSFREVSQYNNEKSLRIVGIGDSVMWGNKVNLEDTFMGKVEEQLAKNHSDVDVINSGVVGYSTLQEKIFYEKFIMNIQPDIIFINFCSNDWLPTEDPFGNLRNIFLNYLKKELEIYSSLYSDTEQKTLKLIIQNFSNAEEKIWRILETMRNSQDIEPVLRKVLLERPIQQMSNMMRKNGTTLVYLFIPDTFPNKTNSHTVSALQNLMKRKNIKFIDFSDQLIDVDNSMVRRGVNENSKYNRIIEFFAKTGILGVFRYEFLKPYNPIENINRISLFARFYYLHHYKNYIDTIGHLSKKGHEAVANRITSYLDEKKQDLRETGSSQ